VEAKQERAIVPQDSQLPSAVVQRMPTTAAGLMALAEMSDAEFDARLSLLKKGQDRINAIFGKLMRKGIDYDVIPGTEKPTLLQPGAETINNFLGLVPTFEVVFVLGDGVSTPVIRYRVFCKLHLGSEDGPVVGTGWGACNTHERRYRYRGSGRTCPKCGGLGTVRESKFERGGFYCNRKDGGCGANFEADDQRITNQQAGQKENPDPWDLENTILKQAEKRAMIGTTKRTSGTSDLFTQDLEEMEEMIAAGLAGAGVTDSVGTGQSDRTAGDQGRAQRPSSGGRSAGSSNSASRDQISAIFATGTRDLKWSADQVKAACKERHGVEPKDLTKDDASKFINWLKSGEAKPVPTPAGEPTGSGQQPGQAVADETVGPEPPPVEDTTPEGQLISWFRSQVASRKKEQIAPEAFSRRAALVRDAILDRCGMDTDDLKEVMIRLTGKASVNEISPQELCAFEGMVAKDWVNRLCVLVEAKETTQQN
jgi:hypothetical protein